MNRHIPWWNVDLGDQAPQAAFDAVAARNISQGPVTIEVERQMSELVGAKWSLATSSGSTALTLALHAAGAREGDTVLCPAYTWIATAHAAHILGCGIEIVDIEPNRPVMDVTSIDSSSDERKFAIPVHMNGHSADVDGLIDKGFTTVEDAAQALGSRHKNRMLGTIGAAGCFSFSVAKIIGSGQGGLMVTNSSAIHEVGRQARTHGLADPFSPETWPSFGHNFRYNDVLASVLLTQIPHLNSRIEHAKRLVGRYTEQLSNLDEIQIIPHLTSEEFGPYVEARVVTGKRDRLVGFLGENKIGARRSFPPISDAKYLRVTRRNETPNALAWSKEIIYLPSGPGITLEEVDYVCSAIKKGIHGL